MNDKLESFEPGTAVVIHVFGVGERWYATEIERQTKTQIITNKPFAERFSKQTMSKVGKGDGWGDTYIHPATEYYLEQVSEYNYTMRREGVIRTLNRQRWDKLTDAQLKSILAIINTQPPE